MCFLFDCTVVRDCKYDLVDAVIRADDETHILSTLKCRLAKFVEPDFGLLDELLRLEVLSPREYAKVRSERTVYERNDALLELLTSEEQCIKFLKALKRSGQQHVVNFIKQNGGQKHNDVITYQWNVHIVTNCSKFTSLLPIH